MVVATSERLQTIVRVHMESTAGNPVKYPMPQLFQKKDNFYAPSLVATCRYFIAAITLITSFSRCQPSPSGLKHSKFTQVRLYALVPR